MKESIYTIHRTIAASVNVSQVDYRAIKSNVPRETPKVVAYWEQPYGAIASGVVRHNRKQDLGAANKVGGTAGRYLRGAAMKGLSNLGKMVRGV